MASLFLRNFAALLLGWCFLCVGLSIQNTILVLFKMPELQGTLIWNVAYVLGHNLWNTFFGRIGLLLWCVFLIAMGIAEWVVSRFFKETRVLRVGVCACMGSMMMMLWIAFFYFFIKMFVMLPMGNFLVLIGAFAGAFFGLLRNRLSGG